MSPIMTGYGFQSTAADVAEGADLSGRHAVVTGGTSPIGMETARELARAGAAVTLAVNDLAAGQHAAVGITAATGNPDVDVARLNLADPKSVAAFAEAWDGPLHLLINNAGITSPAGPHTIEGMEPLTQHFPFRRDLRGATGLEVVLGEVPVDAAGEQRGRGGKISADQARALCGR